MIQTIEYEDLTLEKAMAGCFVINMPNDAYHAYQGISKSGLDLINRSPAHYAFAGKFESTRAMEIGTAIHAAILEPARFDNEYVILKDTKDRRASEYREAVKVHGSERVLVAHEAANVVGMRDACAGVGELHEMMAGGGLTEVSAFVGYKGALLKCRYDWLSSGGHVSIDVKKTQDSSPAGFSRSVFNYRYHVQAAWYSFIYGLITERELSFKLLAIEEKAPYNPMLYTVGEESAFIGLDDALRNLKTYLECEATNNWPGYDQTVNIIEIPNWALMQHENNIVEDIT